MRATIRAIQRNISRWHPLRLLLLGYGSYIVVTWILLCLPWSWQDRPVSPLDNLFVATSAVSTTGLITVNTPYAYGFFGELVILLAFQIGGLGYMTLGSFVILLQKGELSELRDRVGRAAFSLPEGFELRVFLRHVVTFALLVEAAGSAALYFAFRAGGVEGPLWPAVFHAVSAFCTAGFSVFPDSLEGFRGDFWVNAIVSVLSCLGGLGFLVFSDLWQSFTGQRGRITVTSRIILHFTFWSVLLAWILLFLMEPSLGQLEVGERLLASGFQAMTALTTVGFDTHPIATMHMASVLLIIILMVIGASPCGTGGGIKSTTVSAGLATLWSVLCGRDQVTFWRKEVPRHRLDAAFAAFLFYLATFMIGAILLLLADQHHFEDLLFEAASALGTVGLSRGITPELTSLGKVIIIGLMYLGRLGPLTFGLAVLAGSDSDDSGPEDLAI